MNPRDPTAPLLYAYVPEWIGDVTTELKPGFPENAQPVRSPVSKPPLATKSAFAGKAKTNAIAAARANNFLGLIVFHGRKEQQGVWYSVTPRETSIQLAFLMPSDVFKTPSGHNNLTSRMIGRLYPMAPL
jgi:hypothetical protein